MEFINNDQLNREDEQKKKLEIIAATAEEPEQDDQRIASYLRTCWTKAKDAKERGAEIQILNNMQQVEGEYDTKKLNAIKEIGGSEVFMMITDAKCKNAAYWVEDILFRPGQTPFGVEPTPLPELPDDIKGTIYSHLMMEVITQMATQAQASGRQITPEMAQNAVRDIMPQVEEKARQMIISRSKEISKQTELKLDDKLREGGWYEALKKCVNNVILHTGFIVGPTMQIRKQTKTVTDPNTGKLVIVTEKKAIPIYESRHPLFIYPAPNSTGINDGYLFDRIKVTPISLQDCLGVPGYNDSEIMEVLKESQNGKLSEWLQVDQSIRDIYDQDSMWAYDSDKIDCLRFWGYVSGKMLNEWGLKPQEGDEPIEEDMYYNVESYLIGKHVIKVQRNRDPLGRKNVYKASFEDRDGSFWGKGLPEIIFDVQTICNACSRAIVNNVGIACLTGDAVVYRHSQSRKYSPITLLELWERKQSGKMRRTMKLRSLNTDTGEIFGNEIVDVYNNGIADVYEMITEKGYRIKATGTHKFLSDVGEWQELNDFEVGSLVGVNGQVVPLHLSYDTIISIEYCGQEQTYNLQMKAPYHNFVSNGLHCRNSGPQVERNIDRIPATSRADNYMRPWKVWDVTESTMLSAAPALKFYQPPMVVEKLMGVYNQFSKIADEHSGVPAFAHGDPNVGGAGNALADYELILTPDGPIKMGLIKKGCVVVTSYGSTATVTGVFPQGKSDIFRIKFSNGEHVDCDMNHRWSVRDHHNRQFRTMTTEEILEKGLFNKTKVGYRSPSGWRPRWMLPVIDCVEFNEREVRIDPYTMGALIGDGDARCRITSEDQEIFDRIPYPLGKKDNKRGENAFAHTIKGLKVKYLSYGLKCKSTEKFIPFDYLFNSKEIRLELLRGLMDTDGCCSKQGEVFFATSSVRLAEDFVKLVRSLGGIVSSICWQDGGDFEIMGRQCTRQKQYRIIFNLPGEKLFHLDRKQQRVTKKQKTHTHITGIEYIGQFPATCITVDSRDSLFLCENFIPTHNTASGLSMLMGSAARGIKGLVGNIDDNLISPSVKVQYEWLIENEDMRGFVCDNEITTLGSHSALVKEQLASRRMEFLQMTANPIDAQIIGMEGRRYLLEETASSMHLDLTRIFKGSPPNTQGPPPQGSPDGKGGIAPPQKSAELDQSGTPVSGTDGRTAGNGPPGQSPPPGAGGPQPAQIPARASGGPAVGPVVVGEKGPEIFVPHVPGTIVPNHEARKYLGYSSTPMTPAEQEANRLRFPAERVEHFIRSLPGMQEGGGIIPGTDISAEPRFASSPDGAIPSTMKPGQKFPGYGMRHDGSGYKDKGFIGELQGTGDNSGHVMSEYSIGVHLDGKNMEIPSMVPTLTVEEIQHILAGNKPTLSIRKKAEDYARDRMKQSKGVFFDSTSDAPAPHGNEETAIPLPHMEEGGEVTPEGPVDTGGEVDTIPAPPLAPPPTDTTTAIPANVTSSPGDEITGGETGYLPIEGKRITNPINPYTGQPTMTPKQIADLQNHPGVSGASPMGDLNQPVPAAPAAPVAPVAPVPDAIQKTGGLVPIGGNTITESPTPTSEPVFKSMVPGTPQGANVTGTDVSLGAVPINVNDPNQSMGIPDVSTGTIIANAQGEPDPFGLHAIKKWQDQTSGPVIAGTRG